MRYLARQSQREMTSHMRYNGYTLSVRSPRSIRFVQRVDDGVQDLARRTGRDVSSVVNEMLDEGLKMRRIPGIVFGDSRSGRVARVAGTGLGVWEIIRALKELDNDPARLRTAFHWLTDQQLRSALAYAEAYPEEIEVRIRLEERWTPERLQETYPFTRADSRA
jgi:uncharacterized protein (DUF433 family)